MTEETKVVDGSLDNEILVFKFSVKAINGLLQILGQAPFIQSAGFIQDIQRQAGPQIDQLIVNKESKDESQAAS
jgi:hypothetical protein